MLPTTIRRVAALSAPLLSLALVACGGDSDDGAALDTSPIAGGIDIRGKIVAVTTPVPGVSEGVIVIEGDVEPDTRYNRAAVRIKETTPVRRRLGTETVEATIADLQVGTRVEITFAGVVAELDPVQAGAGEVTIIE